MKKNHFYFLFLFLCSLSACSDEQEQALTTDLGVEVVFSAKPSPFTREGGGGKLPSIFIFKKIDNLFSFTKDYKEKGDWLPNGQDDGTFLNSVILPSGNYRFLLAEGLATGVSNSQVFFAEENVSAPNTYDKDYYLGYPSEMKDEKLIIKTCKTDLFVDANEGSFDQNGKEYPLQVGNKFKADRRITRLQARLDLLVRRGVKEEGVLIPIDEGVDTEDVMTNALQKIERIDVLVDGVSSRCYVNGLTFSTPGNYLFSLKNPKSESTLKPEYAFTPFKYESFLENFKEVAKDNYSRFEHSAYCEGPLLFPAPGENEVNVDITIVYKSPLHSKNVKQALLLKRNQVSLITLWLIKEEVGVNIEIVTDKLEYSDNVQGDDGFWN